MSFNIITIEIKQKSEKILSDPVAMVGMQKMISAAKMVLV
jgi:hypothetical protein